jgi:hypothetical protein
VVQKNMGSSGDQPIYDLWGRQIPTSRSFIPNTDWLYRMTVPLENREEAILKGDRMLLNWNLQNPDDPKYSLPAQKHYTRGGIKHYFTDEEYSRFTQIAGELAREMVEDSEGWNLERPTKHDINRLEKLISRARSIARKRMIAESMEEEDQPAFGLPTDL